MRSRIQADTDSAIAATPSIGQSSDLTLNATLAVPVTARSRVALRFEVRCTPSQRISRLGQRPLLREAESIFGRITWLAM